jgi:hypothetical protein
MRGALGTQHAWNPGNRQNGGLATKERVRKCLELRATDNVVVRLIQCTQCDHFAQIGIYPTLEYQLVTTGTGTEFLGRQSVFAN